MNSTDNLTYFLDTYALIEINKANPAYKKYRRVLAATLIYNLAELYYFCLREYTQEYANQTHEVFSEIVKDFPNKLVKDAMLFRYQHKKQKFSYCDALGYIYAISNDFWFVTGDAMFKDFDHVIYIP